MLLFRTKYEMEHLLYNISFCYLQSRQDESHTETQELGLTENFYNWGLIRQHLDP